MQSSETRLPLACICLFSTTLYVYCVYKPFFLQRLKFLKRGLITEYALPRLGSAVQSRKCGRELRLSFLLFETLSFSLGIGE